MYISMFVYMCTRRVWMVVYTVDTDLAIRQRWCFYYGPLIAHRGGFGCYQCSATWGYIILAVPYVKANFVLVGIRHLSHIFFPSSFFFFFFSWDSHKLSYVWLDSSSAAIFLLILTSKALTVFLESRGI